MGRSTGSARPTGHSRRDRFLAAGLIAVLLGGMLLLVGGQSTRAAGNGATADSEFVSLVPACACGKTTVLAAFSLQTGQRMETITHVTTRLGELLSLSGGGFR